MREEEDRNYNRSDVLMYCEQCKSMQFVVKCQPTTRIGKPSAYICHNCMNDTCIGKIPQDFENDETKVDGEWLSAMGFSMSRSPRGNIKWASIIVDDYGKTHGKAHVALSLTTYFDDEWVTDLFSYNKDGEEENCIGLTGSWCKTRADVVRLCTALIEDWR